MNYLDAINDIRKYFNLNERYIKGDDVIVDICQKELLKFLDKLEYRYKDWLENGPPKIQRERAERIMNRLDEILTEQEKKNGIRMIHSDEDK